MTEYVCGFMFDHDLEKVVLINKKRPEWQAGLWNGVGGHIEANEPPRNAMAREFYEETGLPTSPESWVLIGVMETPAARVYFYATCNSNWYEVVDMTDETVTIWDVNFVLNPKGLFSVVPNLYALIGHARSRMSTARLSLWSPLHLDS